MYAETKINPQRFSAVIELLFEDDNLGLPFSEFKRRQKRILAHSYLPADFVAELERAAVERAYQRY